MKKLIFLLTAAICSSAVFATSPKPDTNASAKIQKVFHHDFPEINNPSMTKVDDYYIVFFQTKDNQSCRIFYDEDGNAVQTIRNYEADNLSPFIRTKIESKYKGKQIFMVTDVATESEHYYEILLQDAKSLYVVHARDNGTLYTKKKFKRAI
jgi:hypothetical protein